MPDRRLQVFHAVAKQRSFTRAAETLFMTQPAVTFQVKQLEEALHARLFDRGHGRIDLTPAGSIVLKYAEQILALDVEMAVRVRQLTDGIAGPLAIGASLTIAEYLLPRILGEFQRLHPGVQARLSVANSGRIEDQVAEHALDIGFVEAPTTAASLTSEVCCDDELQVIVCPTHPLAADAAIAPARLLSEPYVSREAGSGTREFTDRYLREQDIDPARLTVAMELASLEAIKGVVGSGLGFAIVSRASVSKEVELRLLAARPLAPQLIRVLSLVYPREKFRSRVVDTFARFAKARMRG